MGSKSKRKNVPPVSGEPVTTAKRRRTATKPFEQGVNPAPLTPPPTAQRLVRSQEPTTLHNRGIQSPLFVAEDEDEVEAADAGLDDDNGDGDGAVEYPLAAAQAVEEPAVEEPAVEEPEEPAAADLPGSATAASVARLSQPQRPESQVEQIDEEPHLHWNYRAWWTSLGKNLIPSAAVSRRNKPLYSVDEDKVWRWADSVVETQQPRAAILDSLTATLYYTSDRQAKADRCTIALQRSQNVAGRLVVAGNWWEFEEELTEMDKESGQTMTCDFDLVLREQQVAQPVIQPASQPARSTARTRPGIVTAIMEEGLAGVVTNERFASGNAIGIRDYWRCQNERCSNNPGVCWVRPQPGRQVERSGDHYPLNGNMIASWASATTRQECTIEQPSEDLQLQFIMSKDRNTRENKRRRKGSPASSNSSIERLTRAILVGHLAQLRAPQQCQHHSAEAAYPPRRQWVDFDCSRAELYQHTSNFFNYWKASQPQSKVAIRGIYYKVVKQGGYDINMLMDAETGMTFDAWVGYYKQSPGMLSHLRRKAHDWMKDYAGLSAEDLAKASRWKNGERFNDNSPEPAEREPLAEISGN